MDKLTKEEVLHVAHLARIDISNDEINEYCYTLKELINEVEKINNVEVSTDEILITPTDNISRLREDENKNSITFEDAKKNIPRTDGNFVEVPVMISE